MAALPSRVGVGFSFLVFLSVILDRVGAVRTKMEAYSAALPGLGCWLAANRRRRTGARDGTGTLGGLAGRAVLWVRPFTRVRGVRVRQFGCAHRRPLRHVLGCR
jgi:hypothetical protein